MASHDQSAATSVVSNTPPKYFGLTLKDILQVTGSLLLPLMLDVFTVVITFEQQRVTREQRLEDRELAREQREQDTNMSLLQREQDKQLARLQREEDERRRMQDLAIAERKRLQDDILAEKQLNMTRDQRLHELEIEAHRHQQETNKHLDTILVSYLDEIGVLLGNHNGTLTNEPVISALARAKTLNILRRLDSVRKTHVIRFLFEAGQLTVGKNPLDLSDSELSSINLSSKGNMHNYRMHRIALAGADLRNASFDYRDLSGANFSTALLDGARFSYSLLNNIDFSFTSLHHADFTGATIYGGSFIKAVSIDVSLKRARIEHSYFVNASLNESAFGDAQIINSTFHRCELFRVSFSKCSCLQVVFDTSALIESDFSNTVVTFTTFINSRLQESQFFAAKLDNANFSFIKGWHVNFTAVQLKKSLFFNSELLYATFRRAVGSDVSFRKSICNTVNFIKSNFRSVDFTETDLSLSTFAYAILVRSTFLKADISMVNMSHAQLNHAQGLTDEQLHKTFSIENAILPSINHNHSHRINIIVYDHADCNVSLRQSWEVRSKSIELLLHENSTDDCLFSARTDTKLSGEMIQEVDVTKYEKLILNDRARLSENGTSTLSIALFSRNALPSHYTLDFSSYPFAPINMDRLTEFLVLKVELSGEDKAHKIRPGWCDDIELRIIDTRYGNDIETIY